ncbi:unnamed protein product, partial [Hymenolepis diminuta]
NILGYPAHPKQLCIFSLECSEVQIELQLHERECTDVFTFPDKLIFIGGWRSHNNPGSKGVDVMHISTGQVLSLPDMVKDRCSPVGVRTENPFRKCYSTFILVPWSPSSESFKFCYFVHQPDLNSVIGHLSQWMCADGN